MTALPFQDPSPEPRTPPEANQLRFFALAIHTIATELLRERTELLLERTELLEAGTFSTIPTITTETRKGRPGTYCRAIFPHRAPESANQRKYYIGASAERLKTWEVAIERTHRLQTITRRLTRIDAALDNALRTMRRLKQNLDFNAAQGVGTTAG